jgi:2-polyprenyl-3-methyl-5-hydroxy-6-metoxy-1,4-benzoquinol methylase
MHAIEVCLICGARSFTEVYPATFKGGWEDAMPFFLTDRALGVHGRIVRCNGCTFVFTTPQFEPAVYIRIYERITQTPSRARQQAALVRFRRLRDGVASYAPCGRFLELGCADGSFLNEMTGYEGIGFESRAAAMRSDGRIISADFREWCARRANETAEPFDFVVAWDVLEHLPAIDEYVVAVNRIIKPGGWFFATLPDISSTAARFSGEKWNCFLLEHLWYFSPITLRRYVRRFNFDLVHIESFRFPIDLGTLMRRFAQTYPTKIIRLPGWLERIVVDLPIGLMFAVCRKSADIGSSSGVPS